MSLAEDIILNSKREGNNISSSPVTGFVLLGKQSWDKRKFYKDIKNDWDITLEENKVKPGMVISRAGNCVVTVAFMPKPIPNGEAEKFAAGNYLWPDAVKTVKTHKSHIIVSVLGNTNNKEKATIYTQVVSSLLRQSGALAVYSEAAVYQPEFFADFASLIRNGEFPVMNVIWFGYYVLDGVAGVYTYGMRKFGREEMELIVPEADGDQNMLRQFMLGLSVMVLGNDTVLNDGEIFELAGGQKLKLTLSDSRAVDGQTLKITFLPGKNTD